MLVKGRAHPSNGLGFLLRQLNHRLSPERILTLSSTERSGVKVSLFVVSSGQQLVERFWVLIDELSELWVVGAELLQKGLNQSGILLDELWGERYSFSRRFILSRI